MPEHRRVIKILAFFPRAGLRGAGVQSRAAVVTPLSWNLDPDFASLSLGFQVLCAQTLSRVQLFATLWTVACQTPLSMGFPRQQYWSGLPLPSPGGLPDPGMEPICLVSPALVDKFFAAEPLGKLLCS